MKLLVVFCAIAATVGALAPSAVRVATVWIGQRVGGRATTPQRLEQYGPAARDRMRPPFERAGIPYPPARVVLLGLKKEKELRVYAQGPGESGGPGAPIRHITTYSIRAASGVAGPKLRAGDRQVPEGVYAVESLNPNSLYHLSLRLNYPNDDDRRRAKADDRHDLGGDIMIHGKSASVGCLAMGDPASEELFVLAADIGVDQVRVILSPCDPGAAGTLALPHGAPAWLADLYTQIAAEIRALPQPG